ncbi:MAG: flagellar basal body rod protein FlgC [Halobacteriovoraceae bacterium]|nr:flagellar basal body rod protein FlgC [Halobacteriovoraceae bacterium]|tara:strand:- start:9822 stop:10259 length:438 start_codon:yes stop_codon:yes gene_type:complete
MDLLKSLKISASGMRANLKRSEVINSNIANAQTTRTAEGGPYRRKQAVFGAEPARDSFSQILEGELDADAQTVHVTEVIEDSKPPILKYDPNHPDANDEGYVAMPNINTVVEMADLLQAQRAYEANATSLNVTKRMAQKALEIGR